VRYALVVTASAIPGVYRLTYADWASSPDDGLRREIIDGELYVTPPPSIEHQRISREIEFRLHRLLTEADLGEVFDAPVGLCLDDENVFEPDLVVVLKGSKARIAEQAVMGPADVVIEILSPGTARRDLTTKRAAYETHGVREYWIVDPEAQAIEVLALESLRYVRHGLYRRRDTLTSSVLPGLSMLLAEVFPARP
jgi:Uma2 family endonuclease